jgi:methionyl-tRNA formyltransferase
MKLFLFVDRRQTYLNDLLIEYCKEKGLNILNIFNQENPYNEDKYDDRINFSMSFLNPFIIKDERIINKKCINIHPSSPKYRGVCGSSMALYNNDEYFGATAHYIDNKIDNGEIILVNYFKIHHENCYLLGEEAKLQSLLLAKNILEAITHTNQLPLGNNSYKWGDIMMTRKRFQDWMIIDLSDNEEMVNKLRGCYNKEYPGPYVKINNKVFELKEKK